MVAGGTDHFVAQGRNLPPKARLVDLSGVAALRGVAQEGQEIRIGALTSMAQLADNPLIKKEAACLAQAASKVGSWQIRSRATLGGNVANASPAADTPPALAALGAEVILLSPQGKRTMAVADFIIGPNETVLADDEVVAGFRLPLKPGRISAFGKIGSRTEVSISRLNMAISTVISENGQVSEPRVFLGTLGLALRRVLDAEKCLLKGFDEEPLAQALAQAVEEAIPGRSTMAYKQSAARALALDVLAELRLIIALNDQSELSEESREERSLPAVACNQPTAVQSKGARND